MPILPDTSWLSVSSEEPSTVSSIFISLDSLFSLSVMALTPKISSAGFVCPSATMLLNAPITASFGSFCACHGKCSSRDGNDWSQSSRVLPFLLSFRRFACRFCRFACRLRSFFCAPASVTSAPASGATIFSSSRRLCCCLAVCLCIGRMLLILRLRLAVRYFVQ